MADDRIEAITALLVEAMQAHGRFEEAELSGVFDQEWPRWYAAYAVEHGIESLVGHSVTVDELADFLASRNVEFEQAEPKPSEPWAPYTARRISAEL